MADLNSTIVRGNLRVTEGINANGTTNITNLTLNADPEVYDYPIITIHNTRHNTSYLLEFPEYYDGAHTIATTGDIPVAGTGLTSSNGVFSTKLNSTTSLGTIGTTSKLYAVGVDANGKLCVNVPWTDTDTNTHYTNYLQIKGNGTEAVKFTQNADKSLNLKPGSNVSISASANEITISATDTNTWRPVVDNLTSTDTDKSLSANQGKVLKGLVDGKAASDHKHSQYLTSHLYRPIKIKDTTTVIGNTSSTALNLKEGTNISLSHDGNGGITISSTASGSGGGITRDWIFQGAGDISGQYHQDGSWSTKINIVSQGYKLLVFDINISDYEFPFCTYVPSSSFSYNIRYVCSTANGTDSTVVDIVYSDSSFTATQVSGNGALYNVNIYAYK